MREENENNLPAGVAPEGKIEVPAGGLKLSEDRKGTGINAWTLALVGAVASLTILCTVWPDPYLDVLAFLPGGLVITFQVTILSILCAIPLGLITGLGRLPGSHTGNIYISHGNTG